MKKSLILLVLFILLAAFSVEAKNAPRISDFDPLELYETVSADLLVSIDNGRGKGFSNCDSGINFVQFMLDGVLPTGEFIVTQPWSSLLSDSNVTYTGGSIGCSGSQDFKFVVKAPLVNSDTDYSIMVLTNDQSGSTNSTSFSLKVLNDALSPKILSFSPSSFSIVNNKSIPLSFTFEEAESGFVNSDLSISYDDNTAVNNDGNTSADLPLSCSQSSNAIFDCSSLLNPSNLKSFIDYRLTNVRDNAGNVIDQGNSFPYHLFIDNNVPPVSLIYPINNLATNKDNIDFKYSSDDDSFNAPAIFNPSLDCDLIVDSSVFSNSPSVQENVENVITSDIGSLDDGVHSWSVSCFDKVKNAGYSEKRSFLLDRNGPVISLPFVDGSILRSSDNIDLSVSDEFSSVDSVWYDFGSGHVFLNSPYSIDISSFIDGSYDLIVYASDSLNNVNDDKINFIVDTIAPVIDSFSPSDGNISNGNLKFSFKVSDNHASNVLCALNVDNNLDINSFSSGSEFSVSKVLVNGDHSFSLTCDDSVGNSVSSGVRSLTVDNVPPSINLLSPSNNLLTNFSSYSIMLNVDDSYGVEYCNLYVDNSLVSSNDSIVSNDINFDRSWNEGNSTWRVECSDRNSNLAISKSRLFSLDTTLPVVNINSPLSVEFQRDSIHINWSVDDINGEEFQLFELLDSNNNIIASSSVESFKIDYKNMILPRGLYKIHVRGSDKAGNIVNVNQDLNVDDKLAPYILSFSPSNNSQLSHDTSSVIFHINTDEESSCKFNHNSFAWDNLKSMNSSNSFNHSYIIGLSPNTFYSIIVVCEDFFGNIMDYNNGQFFNSSFSVAAVPSPPGSPGNGGGGGGRSNDEVANTTVVPQVIQQPKNIQRNNVNPQPKISNEQVYQSSDSSVSPKGSNDNLNKVTGNVILDLAKKRQVYIPAVLLAIGGLSYLGIAGIRSYIRVRRFNKAFKP